MQRDKLTKTNATQEIKLAKKNDILKESKVLEASDSSRGTDLLLSLQALTPCW